MADDIVLPPPDGRARIAQAVSDFSAVTRGDALAEAGGGGQNIAAPIPVYGLGMPAPDSNPETVLARTHQFAWRYLVLSGPGPNVADLRTDSAVSPILDEAPGLAGRIVEAGQLAEARVDGDSTYEFRLLDLPIVGQSYRWATNPDPEKPERLFDLEDAPFEVDLADVMQRVATAEREKASPSHRAMKRPAVDR